MDDYKVALRFLGLLETANSRRFLVIPSCTVDTVVSCFLFMYDDSICIFVLVM